MSLKGRAPPTKRLGTLYCKTGCGFYGNPAWQGYCSKCHKEFLQKSRHQSLSSEEFLSTPLPSTEEFPTTSQITSAKLKFNDFEEKKKQKQDSKKESVKKFFKKSPMPSKTETLPIISNTKKIYLDSAKEEIIATSKEFLNFFKMLKKPSKDIRSRCKSFIIRVLQNSSLTVEQQSELVQDFYTKMGQHIQSHPAFQDVSAEKLEEMMDGLEKYIMTHIYKAVFCPLLSTDREKDVLTQQKFAGFHWITCRQLEVNFDLDDNHAQKLLKQANEELLKINNFWAPQDKLSCIVKCSTIIFKILQIRDNELVVSADDFLPSLIYVVLKCNPPMLHSNIQYITRFCNPSKLMAGEGGYYFTNLCCAVTYIMDNLDANSINIPQDEFDSYMNGEKPIRAPRIVQRKYSIEALTLMQKNLEALAELHKGHQSMLEKCRSIRKEMEEFRGDFNRKVHSKLTYDT